MSPFGKGVAFPFGVGADGRLRWSEGETNIREAIRIILSTELGERIQLADFGTGLARWLFEPNNPGTHVRLAGAITDALKRWEPRIAVEDVQVAADPADAAAAVAVVAYRLVATGAAERISLTVPLGAN
jgi:hypothetical protein